jgi:hypothetical protein
MNAFDKWENFYLIIGGAAGALIGLQFVVVTLIADRPALRVAEAGAAFSTPSIVHFTTVLALSALISAPWQALGPPSVIWGLAGLLGVVYMGFVIRHLRRQTAYKAVLEDWLFTVLLPLMAYLALLGSAVMIHTHPRAALFTIGADMLLLLLIGVHNTWDAVTYHVFVQRAAEAEPALKDVNREAS